MIQSVWYTLMQVIVPFSVPVLAGVLLVRFQGLETKPLLIIVLYYIVPAMIFTNLSAVQLSLAELAGIALFFLINTLLLWIVAFAVGKILNLPDPEQAGLNLVSTLSNAVNYGLPLILLAFGQLGMEKAAVYVVFQMIFTNTAGVYFASRSNFSVKQAVMTIFKLPAIYAAILAIALRFAGLSLPTGIENGISMVAQALPPIMLAVLGAQMARAKSSVLEKEQKAAFWSGLGIRMLISPFIALLTLRILGIEGLLFPVMLILASMPVAVNAGVMAEKFGASSNFVSKCILWTTISSFIVLPILITLVSQSV